VHEIIRHGFFEGMGLQPGPRKTTGQAEAADKERGTSALLTKHSTPLVRD